MAKTNMKKKRKQPLYSCIPLFSTTLEKATRRPTTTAQHLVRVHGVHSYHVKGSVSGRYAMLRLVRKTGGGEAQGSTKDFNGSPDLHPASGSSGEFRLSARPPGEPFNPIIQSSFVFWGMGFECAYPLRASESARSLLFVPRERECVCCVVLCAWADAPFLNPRPKVWPRPTGMSGISSGFGGGAAQLSLARVTF